MISLSHSCGGDTEDISVMLGGSSTITQSVTSSANTSFNLDAITIGGGAETTSSKTTTTTTTKSLTFSIPPGKQAVYVAGVAYANETGVIQVNYGTPQFGHYIVSLSTIFYCQALPPCKSLGTDIPGFRSGTRSRRSRGSRPSLTTSSTMCTRPTVVRRD